MEILFSNKDIAVVLKPVGLDSEQEVPAAIVSALGGEVFPIHRLDKNVGGCMVYARSKKAAAALSRAVQEGQMQKEYVALVHGVPPEQGDWQDLLWKDSSKNKVFVVQRQRKGVKDARLEFTRLSCAAWCGFCCTPGAVIRFGCSSPPEAIPWWATTNTAPGTRPPPPCSFPAP